MAILVGIDEAGYGPILGPMVVSSTAFTIPDRHLKSDLYSLLANAVTTKKSRLAGRVLITDSKKAYSRSAGIGHLRRTVLAALAAGAAGSGGDAGKSSPDTDDPTSNHHPATTAELLKILCPQCCRRLDEYPWYQKLSETPLGADPDDIHIAATVLKNTLSANNMNILGINACCLDVGHYNTMVSAVKNKATVLFTAVSTLIKQAFDNTYSSPNPDSPPPWRHDRGDTDPDSAILQIIIDRQGGRVNYRNTLARMFPDMQIKIIRQDTAISSYELTQGQKKMRLHFAVKADSLHLPVALASMTSKYIRELLIGSLNSYFLTHCTHLKPTAGYWKDGLRFIEDIKGNLPHLKYDSEKLIRSR